MSKRIVKVSSFHNAKVATVVWFLITLPFAIFAIIGFINTSEDDEFRTGMMFFMLAPLIYSLMGFFMTWLMCWAYNVAAKITGGIEFETKDLSEQSNSNERL